MLIANIWRPNVSRNDVDDLGVTAALRRLPMPTATAYLDIENWPLSSVDPSIREASIDKMTRVAGFVRRMRPEMKFGFYGAPPIRVYWPILRRDASYQQWLVIDRALRPLAQAVDYIFPSLYTFYDDPQGWTRFAAAQIEQARRYGKPVFPFLWYQYHDSNRFLKGRDIALAAWEQELQFCRERADGLVLWGGAGQDWNENAPWWRATRRVLELRGA